MIKWFRDRFGPRTPTDSPIDRLRGGAWRRDPVPAAARGATTMLMPDELRLLTFLTRDYYAGEGAIIDAGCFLGGSTLALADGARAWCRGHGRAETPMIDSYDLFEVEDWTRGIYFPETTPVGASTRARFDAAIASHAALVRVHEGDITAEPWTGGPIEILFIDVAKHWTVCDWITANFFARLIPGRSVVVQQDYLYPTHTGWLQVQMEAFSDCFEIVCDTGLNSVAFLHTRPIAPERLVPDLVTAMPDDRVRDLLARAAARFSGEQRAILEAAGQHFLEMRNHGRA